MKHMHHIVPKHMGGSDEPSNLIELSIEDHAEAHKVLWEQYGNIEDKIAWQCLSARKITEEDRILLTKSGFQKFLQDEERRNRWRESIKENRKSQVITESHKNNISKGLKKAYENGTKTYVSPSIEFLRENFKRNKDKMAESRRNSIKWKESVTSDNVRQKKRLSDPRSTKIEIDGVIYDSIRQAAKESSYSYYQLRKMLCEKVF